MGRLKERKKILHEPTTHEIFMCLTCMPLCSKILIENGPQKSYTDFLRWLLQVNFYKEKGEKISIKKLATDFKSNSIKVTKWIHEIYEDIFELNYNESELFQREGVKVALYIRSYDNSCMFYISMPVLPREFERINFPFVKSKVGIDVFWVKKIEHEMNEDLTAITIWLEGGFVNRYREFALDKALFQGWIHFMDVHNKHSFELDEELKNIYRN